MSWSASAVFRDLIGELWAANTIGTGWDGLDIDICKVALFNDTITPNKDASLATTRFNTGVWLTSAEVTDATNWVSGGRPVASPVISPPGGTPVAGAVFYDVADTSGAGNVTLTNAFGCLVYDDEITATNVDQGICYNYFGGGQSVTAGTFTIVWHTNGVWRYTL